MSIDVTSKLHDYSSPAMPPIKVHSSWSYTSKFVELEVDGKRYKDDAIVEVGATIHTLLDCGCMALANKDNLPFEEAAELKETKAGAFAIALTILDNIVEKGIEEKNEKPNFDN